MNTHVSLFIYLIVGVLGGLAGSKLKLPAGELVGAMLAVLVFKMIAQKNWGIPSGYSFIVQVLLGVMVGCSFHPGMLKTLAKIGVPLIGSTVALMLTGIVLSLFFSWLGLMEVSTAYLSTSPGAMSAIVWLAVENHSNPTVVTSFHFFRVVFIILTAPIILKYLSHF